MKKKTLIMIVSVLVFALVFTGCAQTTEADTSGSEASSEAVQESAAEGEDAAGNFEIVLVAKTEGIAWFDDMRTGVDEFGEQHPDVTVSQIAPEGGDPAKQAALVEDSIARGVDAICIVPNDPQSLIPAIQKAKEAGIIVITHEASTLKGTVDYDMEAFNNEDFGALYGENLAKAMGGKGKYLGIVGGLTMETHMQWYNAAVNYIKRKLSGYGIGIRAAVRRQNRCDRCVYGSAGDHESKSRSGRCTWDDGGIGHLFCKAFRRDQQQRC